MSGWGTFEMNKTIYSSGGKRKNQAFTVGILLLWALNSRGHNVKINDDNPGISSVPLPSPFLLVFNVELIAFFAVMGIRALQDRHKILQKLFYKEKRKCYICEWYFHS